MSSGEGSRQGSTQGDGGKISPEEKDRQELEQLAAGTCGRNRGVDNSAWRKQLPRRNRRGLYPWK